MFICILVSTAGPTLAAPGDPVTVEFTGEDGGILWKRDGGTYYHVASLTLRDFFGEDAKEMRPVPPQNGEPGIPFPKATGTVEIKNSSRVYSYTFYLRATPMDVPKTQERADAFFDGKDAIKDATYSQELLNRIDTVVTFKGSSSRAVERELYSGKLSGENPGSGAVTPMATPDLYTKSGAWLGTLSPGQTGTVTVDIEIPWSADFGNEFMDCICAVNLTFIASDHLRNPIPEREVPADVQDTEPPLIETEPPPVTPPDDTVIDDSGIPRDESADVAVDLGPGMAQTGGIRTFVLPLLIVLLLLSALLTVTYIKKRKEKEREAAE